MSTAPATDAELMGRVAAGDVSAFEAIYDRHCVQAHSLARHIAGRVNAAEEATQDAFLAVWRGAGNYDPARSTVRSWVLTLVRRRSIDALRRGMVRAKPQGWSDEVLEWLDGGDRTDEAVFTQDEGERTRRLVRHLPPEQRQVIELAYFGGFSQQEIAIGTGVPLGTVKSRARLGLAWLRTASTARDGVAPVVGVGAALC